MTIGKTTDSLIEKLESAKHYAPSHPRGVGFNEGLDTAIALIRQHQPSGDAVEESARVAINALVRIKEDSEYCYGKLYDFTARLGSIARGTLSTISSMGDAGKADSSLSVPPSSATSSDHIADPSKMVSSEMSVVQNEFEIARKSLHDALKVYNLLVERNFYKRYQPEPVSVEVVIVDLDKCADAIQGSTTKILNPSFCEHAAAALLSYLIGQGVQVKYAD